MGDTSPALTHLVTRGMSEDGLYANIGIRESQEMEIQQQRKNNRASVAWTNIAAQPKMEKLDNMTTVYYFLKYSLTHMLIPLGFALAVVVVPLYEPTDHFSKYNLTFLFVHAPLIGVLPAAYQINIFAYFCDIPVDRYLISMAVVYGTLMVLPGVITSLIGVFPVPLLYVIWGSALFGSVNLIFYYYYPRYVYNEETVARIKEIFPKFLIHSFTASGLFVFSVVYLFGYAYVDNAGQILLQFGYNTMVLGCKEVLFRAGGYDNTSTYWAEFTSCFFTSLALPTIHSNVPFIIHVICDVIAFGYQLVRVTDWWYDNVEKIAIIRAGAFLRVHTLPQMLRKHGIISEATMEGIARDRQVAKESNCRTMIMTVFAKMLSPIMFLVFFAFGVKSYNNKFFPWEHISDEIFENTVRFSLILFVVDLLGFILVTVMTIKYFRLPNVVKSVILHTRQYFLYYIGLGCGVAVFPFAMILKHENTWFFFQEL